MSEVQVVGVHRVEITYDLIRLWADYQTAAPNGVRQTWEDFGNPTPEDIASNMARVSVWLFDSMRDLYLIEVIVTDPEGSFDIEVIGQYSEANDQNRQAVYDEQYLTMDGMSLCTDSRTRPSGTTFRIAFFLHFLDLSEPLQTSFGAIRLPRPTQMPGRLATLMPYDPPT